jgi:flagellin
MSLGVLNNLSAINAENSLNNTNNSLSGVLQQLSSGSRINSGADDAAGLSLVNGLEANATALTQSQTNAQEGVGLLQVADGALSQVTNLLNRAVTLATEASNGTLNGTQDTAANQEYQSLLSEVTNIGSTTTYNDEAVFNSTTNIYTGDASVAGASVDALNIRSLSSSNLGDTGGAIGYSNGTNNVFLDLSTGGTNAAATDSLGASTATTTIAVNYIAKGANGSAVNSTANISVGAGTSFANTAQGLISAINGAGLGLTAAFGTATQPGTASVSGAGAANAAGGAGTDTGIIISGAGVGTGTNGAGEVGTLTVGSAAYTLSSGTLTITGSNGAAHNITLGTANSTDTLANLAATINSAGYGVTATVNTSYQNGHASGTQLTLTSANSGVTAAAANLLDSHAAGDLTLTGVPTTGSAAYNATVGTITTSNANQAYTGGTLIIGSNAAITLGVAGTTDNAADLAATINKGNYGVTAALDSTGKILSFTSANSADTFSGTPTVGAGTVVATTAVANHNQIGTVQFSSGTAAATDVGTGTLVIDGTTFTASGAASALGTLATAITNSGLGITASVNSVAVGTAAIGTILTLVSNNPSSEGSTFAQALVDTTTAGTVAVQDTPSIGNSAYYSVSIGGSIKDTTTGGGTLNTGFAANNNGSNGTATISYSDAAGQSLSASDLSNQTDAEAALTSLNTAITDVAAQDGYIGAQINTLNAVSQVLSTQQTNVTSAQNAVQATDYAAATSNLSKYEILSQTGISALAQANSLQQEVTKLLQ